MPRVAAGVCNPSGSEVETGVWIPGTHWPSVSWRETERESWQDGAVGKGYHI